MKHCPESGRPMQRMIEPGEHDQCVECGRLVTCDENYVTEEHSYPEHDWQTVALTLEEAIEEGFVEAGEEK